jgi:hypothetical protein
MNKKNIVLIFAGLLAPSSYNHTQTSQESIEEIKGSFANVDTLELTECLSHGDCFQGERRTVFGTVSYSF